MNHSHLVWVDCEMTGLNLDKDALIEVSCIITDSELNALDEGIDIVIKPPAESLIGMDDVVVQMHTESGLLTELDAGITLAEAEAQLLEYIRGHVPEARKAQLAGSSVHVDRAYLARDMPTLTEYLHYRIVDVSSIKELVRRWYPRAYFASPEKRGGHRALADILDSINELRYYREAVFVAPPGPDSATAKAITAALDSARDTY
jgi:oligoribonuclease